MNLCVSLLYTSPQKKNAENVNISKKGVLSVPKKRKFIIAIKLSILKKLKKFLALVYERAPTISDIFCLLKPSEREEATSVIKQE